MAQENFGKPPPAITLRVYQTALGPELEKRTRYKGKKVVVVVVVVVVVIVIVVAVVVVVVVVVRALEGRLFGCEAGATLGGPAFWL